MMASRIAEFIRSLWFRVSGRLAKRSGTRCVCVGMQVSAKYGGCPGAGVDATRMSNLLSKYGSTTLLLNSQATAASVLAALQEACKHDLAIFFYSGHGGRVRNPKAQDGSGYSEHLCTNNGPLYDHQIWDVVSKAKGRVVLIFDCCHSATMHRAVAGTPEEYWTPAPFTFEMLCRVLVSSAASGPNILVWAGCPANSYSYGDDSGGVMTNAILKASGRAGRTYDEVWEKAASLAASQGPCRTKLGSGFDVTVFR